MGLKYFHTWNSAPNIMCGGTPQQNIYVASSLRFQDYIPFEFWGDCVLTASHLISCNPFYVLDGHIPYDMWFGKKPNYDQIRTFGCLCCVNKGT